MSSEWLSTTRIIGLVAYAISLLACSKRWVSQGQLSESRRRFGLLAGIQLLLLLDMAFDWRWKLHAYWMQLAMVHGVYGERRTPQLLILMILVSTVIACCSAILYRLRHNPGLAKGSAVAAIGTILSLGLWSSEMLSYHFLDQVLYQMVGKAMLVSFLWCCLAAITSFGAWKAGPNYRAGKAKQ